MRFEDQVSLALGALREHRLRSALSMLGIAIGVASVLLLTSIGEGARRYIVTQFTQFGTNLLSIVPGKTETFGMPGAAGGTTRPLTLEDAEALFRVPGVTGLVPIAYGLARVEAGGLGRSVYVFGVTADVPSVWKMDVRQGRFLPHGDPRRGGSVAVLGPKLKRELFGDENALGGSVRAGGVRLRVLGIMESKGQFLGFDMDDVVYVPIATAMRMFDLDEVNEIDVSFPHESMTDTVVAGVTALLAERHQGHEDFTVLTQAGMLDVFGRVMDTITIAVGGIGAISLVVGAIGILTMMWIAVGERTHEIGLSRALGATAGAVQRLFLLEAVALSMAGGLAGLLGGLSIVALLRAAVPALPVHVPPAFVLAALGVSLGVGLVSGVAPARRAARLDPIRALRAE